MVKLLKPPIELVDESRLEKNAKAILVDCGLAATNQLVTRTSMMTLAVIDHHQQSSSQAALGFVDIRVEVAACASITASYLIQNNIEPTRELATAVWYALRTETCGYETTYSDLDREVLVWATTYGSPALLAEIENAPLARTYFVDLALAMQNTFLYGETALCILPQAEGVEIVGEVADLLVRCEGVKQVLCAAAIGADLYLSARTSSDGGNATELLLRAVENAGSAGGHLHRAGGKLKDVASSGQILEAHLKFLRSRWLQVNQVERQRGTRLVKPKEM